MQRIRTLIALASFGGVATAVAQQPPKPDPRIAHVLNRLGYGLRAGDIERVRAMGLEAYIEAQLHPERIPDPVADAKLARYSSLGGTLESLMHDDRPAAGVAVRRREPAIRKAYLAEHAAGKDPGAAEATDADSAAALRRALYNAAASGVVTRAQRPGDFEIYQTRLLRAVYSERQLQEVMVDFWFNHFNIRVGDPYLVTHWTEQVIRPRALGKFEDLLIATATHPAMMLYLDNWLSAAPESVITARLAKWQPANGENRELAVRRRMEFFARTKGLNENYARELMELHTLGVEGGYTQKDVGQVARAFTGWTLSGPREDGTFAFEPLIHDEGDKLVLGRTIKSGGVDEGMEILRMLARHPSTARFVSFKLARRFVTDDPPASVVDAAARTFRETGGDIPAVLRTIFASPEFLSAEYRGTKIKKPLEMVVSSLRAVNADIDFELVPAVTALNRALREMGEPLGAHEAPDGYPDVGSAWVSSNTLYQRMSFALSLTSGQFPGIVASTDAASRLFEEMGYGDPTPTQITQAETLLARRAALGAGGAAAGMMMMADEMAKDDTTRTMRSPSRGAARAAAARTGADPMPSVAALAAIVTAIHLGSPQFQKR